MIRIYYYVPHRPTLRIYLYMHHPLNDSLAQPIDRLLIMQAPFRNGGLESDTHIFTIPNAPQKHYPKTYSSWEYRHSSLKGGYKDPLDRS